MSLLGKLLPPSSADKPRPQLLDIGCCGGIAFDDFARFGDIYGIEPDPDLAVSLPGWRERIEATPFESGYQCSRQYDMALMLDVLEHIADDEGAAAAVARLLRPGGHLLLTVPALPALWSAHDDANHHYRRYRRGALGRLLRRQGFEVVELRYLFGWSLGLVYLRRWLAGRKSQEYQVRIPAAPVNTVMRWFTVVEEKLVRLLGRGVPLGSSLLAVVRKPAAATTLPCPVAA
jgi:SAM-dependent methyltransferase